VSASPSLTSDEFKTRKPSKAEVRELHKKLVDRAAMLRREVTQMEAGMREHANDASRAEISDGASESMDQDITLYHMESETSELADIRRAIGKIEGKIPMEFGKCESSGEWISIARLRAKPHARLTVQELERFERQGFGGEEFGVRHEASRF